MTVHNPHDRFFRESFGWPEIARNYLEEYRPAEVRSLLCWMRQRGGVTAVYPQFPLPPGRFLPSFR